MQNTANNINKEQTLITIQIYPRLVDVTVYLHSDHTIKDYGALFNLN